jgi:hypothetical protein
MLHTSASLWGFVIRIAIEALVFPTSTSSTLFWTSATISNSSMIIATILIKIKLNINTKYELTAAMTTDAGEMLKMWSIIFITLSNYIK